MRQIAIGIVWRSCWSGRQPLGANARPNRLVPSGYVAGEAYRTSGDTGYLAVYRAYSDDPKTPGSAFAPRQALVVQFAGDRALSAELQPRDDLPRGNRDANHSDPDSVEAGFDKFHREIAAKRLPPGTEPCDLGAWSEDRDRKA